MELQHYHLMPGSHLWKKNNNKHKEFLKITKEKQRNVVESLFYFDAHLVFLCLFLCFLKFLCLCLFLFHKCEPGLIEYLGYFRLRFHYRFWSGITFTLSFVYVSRETNNENRARMGSWKEGRKRCKKSASFHLPRDPRALTFLFSSLPK